MKFSDDTWNVVTRLVAESHRLSLSELENLQKNDTARLIAALPYLAGCTDADRIAAQHLSTYLLAEDAESIFDHRAEDDRDVGARLERISHFPDGDRATINRGMQLLELTMVSHYEMTGQTDTAQGVYNPLTTGAWDAEEIKTRLVKEIRSIDAPEMDTIFDLERALLGKWNG